MHTVGILLLDWNVIVRTIITLDHHRNPHIHITDAHELPTTPIDSPAATSAYVNAISSLISDTYHPAETWRLMSRFLPAYKIEAISSACGQKIEELSLPREHALLSLGYAIAPKQGETP